MSACTLTVDVPGDAMDVAQHLVDALAAAGFDVDCDFGFCQAGATDSRQGFVSFGPLLAIIAGRLAEILEDYASANCTVPAGPHAAVVEG